MLLYLYTLRPFIAFTPRNGHFYDFYYLDNKYIYTRYKRYFEIDAKIKTAIFLTVAPSVPEITSKDYDGSFDENSVVNLECSSNGGNTAPTINWLINGNRVGDVEVVVRSHKNGTSTVVAYFRKKMSRAYNGSVLTCAVTNKVLLDQGLPPRVANITLLASCKCFLTEQYEIFSWKEKC